ncbi:heme peroxidase [Pluteus cervinus]|uniref:Heme peroxidase n=1 Tax=Pluteus cervinus TaxID=181527 RepID=A0ACD3AJA7_9AGAR|nr:heme peroxidase [Pluteus cervinus]
MFNFNKLLAFVLVVPFVVAAPGKRALPAICQKLEPVAADLLENLFGGECGDSAHGALRLIFHDAIGISPIVGGGGADGSIVTFNATELTFEANDGLDDVIADVGPFFLKHQDQITSGDLYGELMTAVNGTLRLQSDFEIAHDPRTACTWQEFATNQPLMASKFGPAVLKLSFLGQDPEKLTDCSELIPQPPALKDVPEFPPGQFLSDIQASCDVARFPDLPTQPGPPLDVAPIPQADSDDES